jgi:hypothetical protein
MTLMKCSVIFLLAPKPNGLRIRERRSIALQREIKAMLDFRALTSVVLLSAAFFLD